MQTKPHLESKFGKAWNLMETLKERIAKNKDYQGSLSSWLVHLPPAHPIWNSYTISATHLRDIPGVRPAKKHYPEAEYEITIFALDPHHEPYDPDNLDARTLTPPNCVKQFDLNGDDEKAAKICDLIVERCINGEMSPEMCGNYGWGKIIDATVDHFKKGICGN